MSDFPEQEITIYHKNNNQWNRYVKKASYRKTSLLQHSKNGQNLSENVLIRIFDMKGYNMSWFVENGDIIVNKKATNEVTGTTPWAQLSKQYGVDNVHKVTSITEFLFDDDELPNHIKIGAD